MFYEEIIHPKDLEYLSKIEKPMISFSTKITTKTDRPFLTFLVKYRSKINIKEGDILLLKINKLEFISKVYKWGRINISKKIINKLNLENHELIKVEVISKNKDLKIQNKKGVIDLVEIQDDKIKILPRINGFITIYSKGKATITLRRFIKISPELIELCYLIHGDGHYKYKLYFSNTNYKLHKFVIKNFEDIFRIQRGMWKCRVFHNNLNLIEISKLYWMKNLEFKEQFYLNASKSKLNTKKIGNLRICLDNTIIATIFRFIFDQIKNLDEKDSLTALNGLLAAEGGAQINKVGLHKITLTFNKEEKKLFDNILYNSNLMNLFKFRQNKTYVLGKWEYQCKFFEKFLENNLIPFNLHLERSKNAIYGFLVHSYTKTLTKYLNVLKNKNCLVNEISKQLNHRKDSILDTIRKKRYQKYIRIKGKGIRGNPYLISITFEGIKFLKLIKQLELQLKQVEENMKNELPFEKIKRKVLVKKEAETDKKYGKRPEDRNVEELINYGVICLNKPSGPTSHQVSDYVQKILNIDKAGHGGSLEN